MNHPTASLFDRLIAPWALFLGIVLAFLGCCLGGSWASRHNHLENFERFHALLAPESLFYPTACQVYQLAKSRLDPDKIAVVIGGTSILQGSWQAPAGVWTRKLQALLGDQYQVINFGLCGAKTAEFGATAAEMLARDYPRLILIVDALPATMYPAPDGEHFKYFFWDAYSKGLLLPDASRDTYLRAWEAQLKEGPAREHPRELRAQMRLDRLLYFNDLWTTLAYTRFVTVWNRRARDSFTRPRRLYPDSDQGPEPGHVYFLPDNGNSVRHVLAWVNENPALAWDCYERSAAASFPQPVRKRTLLLVTWRSPLYLRQLSSGERACLARVSQETVRHLEKLEFSALEVGAGYAAADFADFCHLVESGGAKLAANVAPRVRALARKLGYTR